MNRSLIRLLQVACVTVSTVNFLGSGSLIPGSTQGQAMAQTVSPLATPGNIVVIPPPELATERPVTPLNVAAGICPSQLAPEIDRVLQRSTYASARWSIHMEALDYQATLYSHDPTAFLIPASNVKLFTTAAALQTIAKHPERAWHNFEAQLTVVNRDSDNWSADGMLKRIGGPQAVKASLADLGLAPQLYQQVDGSGLSRRNATNAATLVELLKAMRSTPGGDRFYSSLPISGINGTLRNRFVNTPIAGRVHAKTGTLTGVRALSGYLEHPVYGTIAFSILVNQTGKGDSLRRGIDDILMKVGQLVPCEV